MAVKLKIADAIARRGALAAALGSLLALASCASGQEAPARSGGDVVEEDGLRIYTGDGVRIRDDQLVVHRGRAAASGASEAADGASAASESGAGASGASEAARASGTSGVPPAEGTRPALPREREAESRPADASGGAAGPAPPPPSSIEEIRRRMREKNAGKTGGELDPAWLTLAHERTIGESAARAILMKFRMRPVGSPASLYVRKVGAILAERSERPGLTYRFAVIETDVVNAFSAPDGYVFITTGALRFIRDEAELAVVLAHEIGHVELKHGLHMIAAGSLDRWKRSIRDRALSMSRRPASEVEKEIQGRMDHLSDLVLQGKGRPQEEAADRWAIRAVAEAGYDPSAAVTFFARLARQPGAAGAKPRIFQSHPHARERVRAAEAAARRFSGRGARNEERYRAAVRSLGG